MQNTINKKVYTYIPLGIFIVAIIFVGFSFYYWYFIPKKTQINPKSESDILGKAIEMLSKNTQKPATFRDIQNTIPTSKVTIPQNISSMQAIPTDIVEKADTYSIQIADPPKEIIEGETATFHWIINGPSATIHSTAVYFGKSSNSGQLMTTTNVKDTSYSDFSKEFIQGDFIIPLWFTGNIVINSPGQYYYRIHALVKEKNYWSSEYSLLVNPVPKHEIYFIGIQSDIYKGATATITWEIKGPISTTSHTAVYISSQSIPNDSVNEKSPLDTEYKMFINDFTNGNYNIPLRFIGNGRIDTTGTVYYRAHAYINGKNIWSEEKSFKAL